MKTIKCSVLIMALFLMLVIFQVGTVAASEVFTLNVNFPSISSVHIYIKYSDGLPGTATGQLVTSQTYKNDQAIFTGLPIGTYDIAIVKGAKTLVVDDVNFNSDTVVENLVATLTVKFPGISGVHTYIKTTTGGDVDNRTYKNEETSLSVLKSTYKVTVVKGAQQNTYDVDCSAGDCTLDNIVAALTVNFPGLNGVHTYVKTTTNGDVDNRTYKNSSTSLAVLKAPYKVTVVKGAQQNTYDIDCSMDTCMLDDIVTALTVKFPGINGVHTYIKTNDGVTGFSGGDVDNRTYQNSETLIILLKSHYDVKVVKGAQGVIYDDVDCTGDTCSIENIVATLTVNFPGNTGVHTYVKINDGVTNSATGGDVDNRTYQNNSTTMTLLKSYYDLVVKIGVETHILDETDCTDNVCSVSMGNKSPVAQAGGSYNGNEGAPITMSGASASDLDDDLLTYNWSMDSALCNFNNVSLLNPDLTCTDNGVFTATLTVTNGVNPPVNSAAMVTVINVAPTASLENDSPILEGGSAIISFSSVSDLSSIDTVTGFHYAFNCNGDSLLASTYTGSGTNYSMNCAFTDNGNYIVSAKIMDKDGDSNEYTTIVTVNNVAPTLGAISVNQSLVPVNVAINANALFTDPGILDTHIAVWDWGDGTTPGTVTEVNGSGIINGNHAYAIPGVYKLALTITDKDDEDAQSFYEFVVVYDPNGGFVTGGGWILSPAGAYKNDPTLTGKATFGFVAKYRRGANVPDGNTQFQFKAGNLNFQSTRYEWLVVAGNKVQFKGEGTINGQGSYKFMIWADDDTPDTFRIQIWGDNGTVYDNGSQQPLGGGSIVVHQ